MLLTDSELCSAKGLRLYLLLFRLNKFHNQYQKLFTVQRSLYVLLSGHYMYRTVVTICTVQWSLYVLLSGHYM